MEMYRHYAREKLTATVKGANKKAAWISENPEVATVDATGLVQSVAPGTAKIISRQLSLIKRNMFYIPVKRVVQLL